MSMFVTDRWFDNRLQRLSIKRESGGNPELSPQL